MTDIVVSQLADIVITADPTATTLVVTAEQDAVVTVPQQGPPGVQGPIGLRGPVGPVGAVGPVGPQGLTGAIGPQGSAGPAGPVGVTGAIGPVGATGAVGPQGATGAVGPVGAVGAAGPQGPVGAVGAQGATGAVGPQGALGPAGPAPTTAQMQAAVQPLVGAASGIAGLDATSRLPVAQDLLRAWQVVRAARTALVNAGGSWSGFLSSNGASNADATDGSYESVQGGTPAPTNGVLSGLLSTYLQSVCGQTQAQATSSLQTIWANAASLTP